MENNALRGAWGEALACEYLRKKRYKVIACNYRCRFGEIDIIAENRKYLVFVEVKLRKTDAYGTAREFVDLKKQDRLRQTAMLYLSERDSQLQPRFDVIEIYAPDGINTTHPKITHLENAFSE